MCVCVFVCVCVCVCVCLTFPAPAGPITSCTYRGILKSDPQEQLTCVYRCVCVCMCVCVGVCVRSVNCREEEPFLLSLFSSLVRMCVRL